MSIGTVNETVLPSEVITALVEALPKTQEEFVPFVDVHKEVLLIDFTKIKESDLELISSSLLTEVVGITSFIIGKGISDISIIENFYGQGVENFFTTVVGSDITKIEQIRIDSEKIVIDIVEKIVTGIEVPVRDIEFLAFRLGLLVSIYSFFTFTDVEKTVIEHFPTSVFELTKVGVETIPEVVVPVEEVVFFNELAKIISKI